MGGTMQPITSQGVVSRLINRLVRLLFGLVILYLILLAAFSTSAISDTEHTYLLPDRCLGNLLIEAGFISLIFLHRHLHAKKRPVPDISGRPGAFRTGMLLLAGLLCTGLVLLTQQQPYADQLQVFQTVRALHQRSSEPFLEGGYLNVYPHQSGFILFSYLLSLLAGTDNYLVFQLLNALCVVWLLGSLCKILRLSGEDSLSVCFLLPLCIAFVPLFLYVPFIYGTLPGLALSVFAYRSLLVFIQRKDVCSAALSIVCIFLAVFLKNNYLIFLIGLMLFTVHEALSARRAELLCLLPFFLAVLLLTQSLAVAGIEQLSGQKIGRGMHPLAWVSMGLQEDEERANGWWNHSTTGSYRSSQFDYDRQGDACRAALERRISEFIRNPRGALRFFVKKNASQWNNPDFQAFHINQVMSPAEPFRPGRLIYLLLSVRGAAWVHPCLNALQFILLCGVLFFLLLTPGEDASGFFYQIVFIGGFVFHTFWEAKCQYTLPFFLLLFPLSASGYRRLYAAPVRTLLSPSRFLFPAVIAGLLVFSGIIATQRFSLLNNLFIPEDQSDEYQFYLDAHRFVLLPEGEYSISPSSGTGALLCSAEGSSLAVSSRPEDPLDFQLKRADASDAFIIKAGQGPHCLSSFGQYPEPGQRVTLEVASGSPDQRWMLLSGPEKTLYAVLFRDNMALTLCPETGGVTLEPYEELDSQFWKFVPCSPMTSDR